MRRLAAAFLVVLVVAGCAIYRDHGFYDASQAAGWRKDLSEGTNFFYPPAASISKGFIAFSSDAKGKLMMVAHFPGREVRFDKQEFTIIPNDGGSPISIPVSAGMRQIGSADFTVELPPFTVDGLPLPALRARFVWTDRAYYVYRGPQ
jgi:hypothetical protein